MLSGTLVPSFEVANSRVTSISENETGEVLTSAVFFRLGLAGSNFKPARRLRVTLVADVFSANAAGAAGRLLRGAWPARVGFEVAGRLAATSVLSQLRMGLVNRRLVDQPAALDGAHSGELATAAVFGAVPLEAYFGRFLPQLVLACVVPVAVIVWIVPIDATSAAIMLLTLPLVPLFMILVGTYTRRRTSQRRQALDLLASHFLDVIRGLPTLRAFNRGETQAESIAEPGDGYRRATIGTLPVAFLSGRCSSSQPRWELPWWRSPWVYGWTMEG